MPMQRTKPMPRLEDVEQLLSYAPDSGVLLWKPPPAHLSNQQRGSRMQFVGKPAGFVRKKDGYREIKLTTDAGSVCVLAHRVAWGLFHGAWPESEIDHINHIRDDNRIVNLRLATRQQNCAYRRVFRGVEGVPGVSRDGSRFQARIAFNGATKYLGRFKEAAEAGEAYRAASLALNGEFAPVAAMGLKGPTT